MAAFEIIVQYRSGRPAPNIKISNGYNYKNEYTDSRGRVVFEVGSSSVTLYVEGRDEGKIHPGKTVITLDR